MSRERINEESWDVMHLTSRLEKTTVLQIVLNHHIRDRVKDELDVTGIGGTGEVRVDLFLIATLVQTFEFHLNVCSALLVGVGTCNPHSKITQVKQNKQ